MELLVFAGCFLLLILLVLGYVIPICRNHREVTGRIINYDPGMRKFVYKMNLPYRQFVELLNTKCDADELSCTFDFDKSVIRFSEYGSYRDYYFQIQACEGFSILRLEQAVPIGMKSAVPLKLNPFLVSKLHAELIPFSQYGF